MRTSGYLLKCEQTCCLYYLPMSRGPLPRIARYSSTYRDTAVFGILVDLKVLSSGIRLCGLITQGKAKAGDKSTMILTMNE
jgi:hypothetical protein